MLGVRLPPSLQLRVRRVIEWEEADYCAPRLLLPPTQREKGCGKVPEGAPTLLLPMLCVLDLRGVVGGGDFPHRVPSSSLPVMRAKDFG